MRSLLRRIMSLGIMAILLAACQVSQSMTTADSPEGGAAQVVVTTGEGGVVLSPAVVPAGPVFFRVEQQTDPAGHASGWEFVSRAGPCDGFCPPKPMAEADVELLRRDSAPQGFGYDSGWGAGVELTLAAGLYVFMVPGPTGAVPGRAPESVTVLTVE